MKPFSTLLLILAFYSVLPAQEINFSPLPDTCFDQFTFFLPKSQTDAPEAKFTPPVQFVARFALPRYTCFSHCASPTGGVES